MCLLIFSTTSVWNVFHSEKKWARYDLHVKYPLFLSDINETWTFLIDFRKKTSNNKFHENPSSGSKVVPCGQMGGGTDRHDKANSRFSQFVNEPKNGSSITVNFHTRLCLKIHWLEIKNFEEGNYHEKRAAHWYSVITLLFKPLKQRLIDISAFRTSKSLYSR